MWPIKTILYLIVFCLGCIASLVNPIWGVVNYVLVYQLNPTNTWWGKPLMDMGVRYSLTAMLFLLIGYFLARKKVPRIPGVFSFWELGLFIMVLLGAATRVWGISYDNSSEYAFEKLWKMLLFVFILGRLTATRTNLLLMIWTIVAGAIYLGYDAYTANPDDFVHGRLEEIGGADFSTTSGAAAHTVAMLPIIGAIFLISRPWYLKATALIAGGLAFNTFILCRTRSAFVGLAVGILAALALAPKARRFRIYLFMIMGGITAFSLTDHHFWERISTLTDRRVLDSDLATVNRKEIWKVCARVVADHPMGIGPGNAPTVIGTYDYRYWKRSTHNTLVVTFVELGVPGGTLLLAMTAGSFWFLRRAKKIAPRTRDPDQTNLLAYGFLISLVTYFVTGLGTERFYCESFWWIMAMPLALYRIALKESTEGVLDDMSDEEIEEYTQQVRERQLANIVP